MADVLVPIAALATIAFVTWLDYRLQRDNKPEKE